MLDSEGKFAGVRSQGVVFKGKRLLADPSYFIGTDRVRVTSPAPSLFACVAVRAHRTRSGPRSAAISAVCVSVSLPLLAICHGAAIFSRIASLPMPQQRLNPNSPDHRKPLAAFWGEFRLSPVGKWCRL